MDARTYAVRLVAELQALGAELPPYFLADFLAHAHNLGSDCYGDLGAMVIVECLELKKAGQPLDATTMRRGLDRIRQRLTRELKRSNQATAHSDWVAEAPTTNAPAFDHESFRKAMSHLNSADLMLTELLLAEHTTAEIAARLGLAPAAVRKRISRLYEKLRVLMVNTISTE